MRARVNGTHSVNDWKIGHDTTYSKQHQELLDNTEDRLFISPHHISRLAQKNAGTMLRKRARFTLKSKVESKLFYMFS